MKAIFVIALIVLAANAQNAPTSTATGQGVQGFDAGAYFTGFADKLGFTQEQVQDATTCLSTVQGFAQQLAGLLQMNQGSQQQVESSMENQGTIGSGSEGSEGSAEVQINPIQNIENLISTLLTLYGSAKSSILGDCQPVLQDLLSALQPDLNNPSLVGLPEDATLDEILSANWDFYFPQIIKQFGTLVQQLHGAQFNSAGATNAYILQILFGVAIPQALPQATLPLGKSVAFNQKNFFTQFFTAFFNGLGGFKAADITNNIKSLSSCYDAIGKIQTQIINFQTQIAKLSVLDSFYATKGFFTTFASNLKACRPAYQLVDTLRSKIVTKVNSSNNNGWYQVFLNLSLNVAQLENSLMTAAANIDQGKYDQAGTIAASTLKGVFTNAATFPL